MVRGAVPKAVQKPVDKGGGGVQDNDGDPPTPEVGDPAWERRIGRLKLRQDIPIHKAASVALIEEGYRDWLKTMLRGLRVSATPGRKMNRTAVNGFQKALSEAGRLADAVQALFRRLNVDSEEELEHIVNAYRLAQRAEPEDNLEVACMTIDAHLRERPEDRDQLVRRFGGAMKGTKDA